MLYMGGKARIAKHVVQAILTDTSARDFWWEPFVGGGNVMEHAAPHFKLSVGSDIHPDLIMMWEHVTAGGMIPEFVSREEYNALRAAPSSWLRGYVGFGASFGGKWFGGYADFSGTSEPWRSVTASSFRTVSRQAGVFAKHDVRFALGSYDSLPDCPIGTVIYCDPPYAGTTAYASTGAFDYRKFYAKLAGWARDRYVYLSEYDIPEGVRARVAWERKTKVTLRRGDDRSSGSKKDSIERLYRILP